MSIILSVKDILKLVMHNGSLCKVKDDEIMDYPYIQCIIKDPWSTYPDRKYDINYFKREFQWYLNADPFDKRITKFAKTWEKIKQPNGSIFSNYGQYWFGRQNGFRWVVESLLEDPRTRQAYIPMCNASHIFPGNKDMVCTKGIQFRNVDDHIHMHVCMRSSDAIWGLGTDLPCFYVLWHMVCVAVGKEPGYFIFSSDSVHVYKRHFEMAGKIIENEMPPKPVEHPPIIDAADLIEGRFQTGFGRWLTEVTLNDPS